MAMDPVNKKAVKKDFKDRKDQDIDNDGDVDSSDEYLHKRRKAVSKAINSVKESVELDEKVYASDYNVGAKKSQFGGYTPIVTHKKKGHTMYAAQQTYKTPEHAKGHAAAYLKGYEALNDRHADRKAREYAKANKQHTYNESVELDEKAESQAQAIAARIALKHKREGTKPEAGTASAEMMKMSEKDLEDYTKAKKGAPKKVEEEAEGLDEISKDMADRYYRKAAKDIGSRAMSGVYGRNSAYKSKKDAKANYQTSSLGTTKTTDDDRKKHTDAANKAMQKVKDHERKVRNRAVGMSRASARMEEVEGLDEISKKTLASYVKKAASDMYSKGSRTAYHKNKRDNASGPFEKETKKKHQKLADYNYRKAGNRAQGIERATDRLTKEKD